jgi:hypothetical protein
VTFHGEKQTALKCVLDKTLGLGSSLLLLFDQTGQPGKDGRWSVTSANQQTPVVWIFVEVFF